MFRVSNFAVAGDDMITQSLDMLVVATSSASVGTVVLRNTTANYAT
jgi:hypothetical protein